MQRKFMQSRKNVISEKSQGIGLDYPGHRNIHHKLMLSNSTFLGKEITKISFSEGKCHA